MIHHNYPALSIFTISDSPILVNRHVYIFVFIFAGMRRRSYGTTDLWQAGARHVMCVGVRIALRWARKSALEDLSQGIVCRGCQDRHAIRSLLWREIVFVSWESGALEDRVTDLLQWGAGLAATGG